MTDTFITVKAGGIEIEDGAYPVQLVAISDPRTVTAQRGVNAGKDIDLIDWTWTIDAPGTPHDGLQLDASTSTASGPKSKMYAWLTALHGGKAPAVGQSFAKSDLIGRLAVATIRKDDQGWPRIENLSAMPVQMAQQRFAATTGAPVAASPAPTATAQPNADLPF
jgi:hypothetical protein